MARLFFIENAQINKGTILFSEEDRRHFISLRKNSGDIIECILLSNDKTFKYIVSLIINKGKYIGQIISKEEIYTEEKKKIHILQCIPKLDKMDLIIQKCSELNVQEIVPIFSRNTQIQGNIGENKLSRWSKISKESSIQSGRVNLLIVSEPERLGNYLSKNKELLLRESSFTIILNEFENNNRINDFENLIKDIQIKDIYIAIGSEGGFDKNEIEDMTNNYGFKSISLGARILRTETAPIVISALLQYIIGGL